MQINYKKNYLFFIACIFFAATLCLNAQNREIRFEHGNWQKALARAKRENKMVYLDCYTTWCGPCLWAKTKVFTNDTVADFYNAHFICVAMDMEKGEGIALGKKYQVKAYPTMLYLNADGELQHRVCGASQPKNFIEDGETAISPQGRLAYWEKLYNKGATDPATAYKYFKLLDIACFESQKPAEKFLFTQPDNSLLADVNWAIITDYAGYSSKAFKYLEKHAADFANKFGSYPVEKKLNNVYAVQLNKAYKNKDKGTYSLLKKQFLLLNTKDRQQVIDRAELKMSKQLNNDLKDASVIHDSIVGPLNVSLGKGKTLDCKFETNSAWFKLNIDHDTLLTFDIVPVDSLDDYDFFLFNGTDENSIGRIKAESKAGDRICRSYCTSKSGMTGLSRYAREKKIGAGPGPAYAMAMPVKAGEIYYLLVDFPDEYTRQGWRPLGFSIYFYDYWPKRYPVILNNVFFESNKAVLLRESYKELDLLVTQLKKSQVVIEVQGHTDNSGSETNNQLLSEQRAEAVVNYLRSKNISEKRLFYKGYGSRQPVASNENENGRKKNRRVEFVVVLN